MDSVDSGGPDVQLVSVRALFVLLVAACVGCGFQPMQEVRVSDEFSGDEQAEIMEALAQWEEATGQHWPLSICQGASGDCSIVPATDCRDRALAYTHMGPARRPVIYICNQKIASDVTRASVRQVALHELGHALAGDDSHLGDGHVMSDRVDPESKELTERDAQYVGLP